MGFLRWLAISFGDIRCSGRARLNPVKRERTELITT